MIDRNPDDTWTSDALERGDVAAVMRRAGEDPAYLGSRDFIGDTPLLTAIAFGDLGLVEFLLDRGADPDPDVDDGYTALLSAVESGRPASARIVSRLIAAGADIHRAGINGWTPLHMAAARGLLEKARLLLDAGARVDERAAIDAEETPLMEAAHGGHPAVVRLLLEHGADPSMRDTIHGRTPLEMARYDAKGADPEVLGLLKTLDFGPEKADLLASLASLASLDVPPEARAMMEATLAEMDMAEIYRENADRAARDGDHDGVIRVLSEFERDGGGPPGPRR